jgi:hypothetical protein
MDERASCIGGMTDDMARALAVHCRQLGVLEVYFQRYSLPSELFTDDGLIALTEGCRSLRRLTLHNCDRISDRCAEASYGRSCICVVYQGGFWLSMQLARMHLGGWSGNQWAHRCRVLRVLWSSADVRKANIPTIQGCTT